MGERILLDLSSLNQMQLDAIREIGNIGAGHAATAISEMLGCVVEIDVPKAELVSIYELDSYYDDPSAGYAAVFASSDNDKPFNFMLLIKEADVSKIVGMLVAKQFGMQMDVSAMPSDMIESALGETGNILLGSFLNSVNGLLGLSSGITPPSVTHDTLGAILSFVSAMFGQHGDTALVTKTQLNVLPTEQGQSESIDANILMATEPDALEMLLSKLGVI
jgi:chemotaxis protein CheC